MRFNEFVKQLGNERQSINTNVDLVEEVTKEIYEDIPYTKVAEIISKYYDIKVTDTLIEEYINVASSNTFSVDPVVDTIRKMNKFDTVVEGKISYTLEDNSVVAINETTQSYLNKLLADQIEIIAYMRESKDNFIKVIELIGE